MDYQLANRLNDTIQIIESKLSYPIDIIINTSVGIVITSSEYLIQVDSDNNFLILKELIHCKMYLLEVYVVAAISNPWFLEHCGENFQKLQILALGFDIKIVLVIKEELFQYIIDLIILEGPEVVNNFIDQTNQECSFYVNVDYHISKVFESLKNLDFMNSSPVISKTSWIGFQTSYHRNYSYVYDMIITHQFPSITN